MTESEITSLFQEQVMGVMDGELRACILDHRVKPYCIEGQWQYSRLLQSFPCWVVLEVPSSPSETIVYCEQGFGPAYSWGIINRLTRKMGMDCDWHVSLEHAVRNTSLWRGKNPPEYEIP